MTRPMTAAEHIEEARVAIAAALGKPPSTVHAEQIALWLAGRVVDLDARLAVRDATGTRAWANIDDAGRVLAMSTVPTSACRYPVRIVADPARGRS